MNPFFNVIQMLWCFHIECLSPCTCCSLQTVLISFYFFFTSHKPGFALFLMICITGEKKSTNGKVIICVIIIFKPFYFRVCEVEIPLMDYFNSKPVFLLCRSDECGYLSFRTIFNSIQFKFLFLFFSHKTHDYLFPWKPHRKIWRKRSKPCM